MNKFLFAVANNILNILPASGRSLIFRGYLATKVLKKSGKNLKISSNVNLYNPANIITGDNVYIGYSSYIGGGDVVLHDEVVIGPFCSIVAGNHTMEKDSFRYGEYDCGKIVIGKGSWLGSHCTIVSNVNIGKGCLIAAGSVVNKDVSDFSMVAGIPAKFIKNTK